MQALVLRLQHGLPTCDVMRIKEAWQALGRNPVYRLIMFSIGCVLVVCAPLVSPLPGPGGLLFFGVGMGLVLRNSLWAKKRYAAFKKVRPKMGGWADWGLRRKSARRRAERARQARQLVD